MIARFKRELSVAAALLLLLGLLAVFAPTFYSGDQPRSILVNCGPLLVLAAGMTLVILVRQIDISIGSQFALCGIAAGLLAKQGVPMPIVGSLILLLGATLGAVNGGFIAGLNLPSIVVTLATMVILRDGLRWTTEGKLVRDLPDSFQWFGLGQAIGQWLMVGVGVAVVLAFTAGLRYVAAGRVVYAVGSDAEAARLAGIRPKRVVFVVFVMMGALTGLAALLNAACFSFVDPKAGDLLELKVIAAVVVGGVAISGGRGTLLGAAVGVLLLATLGPALTFFGVGAAWDKAFQGAIILLAVAVDGLALGRRSYVAVR